MLTLSRIIACAGAGSAYSIQAWLFAQLLNVTTYTGQALQNASNHWSLMFFVLAIGTGLAYFVLGSSSNTISTVRIDIQLLNT